MTERIDFNALAAQCAQEEARLQFASFSRQDALALGLLVAQSAAQYDAGVAVEITVNGLTVFRYFPEGTTEDNALWLARKRRTVTLTGVSSLHALANLEIAGESAADRKLDPNDYAFGGGGFPILLRGTGMIGVVAVSGLTHWEDHALVVRCIEAFLG